MGATGDVTLDAALPRRDGAGARGIGPLGPAGRRRRARALRPAHGGTWRLSQLPPATGSLAGVARTGAPVRDIAEGRRWRVAAVGVYRRRRAVSPAHHPRPSAQRRW